MDALLKQIRDFEIKYQIRENLLLAVVEKESNFNPSAVGGIGEVGLCQITKIALQDYNDFHKESPILESELYEPEKNLEVGAWLLGVRVPQLLRSFKFPVTLRNIIECYNQGIGNVDNKPLTNEITKSYYAFVLRRVKMTLNEFIQELPMLLNLV